MSNEKKLHGRLERLMSGLGGVAHNGEPVPTPVEPEAELPAATPGAPIDPHAVIPGWTWETDAHGRYTACSGEITALLGFDPAALQGQPLTHIAVPADSAARPPHGVGFHRCRTGCRNPVLSPKPHAA